MRATLGALALVAASTGACTGASPDPGLTAQLQVAGAQLRPGPFPPDDGGPAAVSLRSAHAALPIGQLREPIVGALEPTARVAAIGIEGSDDSWLVVAGPPDLDTPDLASVHATVGLAADFPAGPVTLIVAAADERGRFGAPATVELVAAPVPPPDGELVIELAWDGPADLDLHVVDPLGGEAWSDDPNTFDPPPGEPVDPDEYKNHGILDHDANAGCHREPHPAEHVVWSVPPPPGDYVVRVDTPALCGAPSAPWFVAAYRKQADGARALIGSARGIATPDDVQQPRGRGAGVLALRFSL